VQDLPRDQGVGSKQLVLTFNGSLAEEKADKHGSAGGNNLCVMNKFTMKAGVTTKVRVSSRAPGKVACLCHASQSRAGLFRCAAP
jgi:hypothetical protein